jgi:outer membrane lipoprotein
MRTHLFLAFPLLLFLAGCTHIISDASLGRADRSIEFGALRKAPDDFRGKFVILGGLVTAVRQTGEGVQLEVVEYPLDIEEMPDSSAGSGGRFLVNLPPDVGYATFKPGVLVTMAGEVVGTAVKPLDNVAYTYPVLVVKEIHIIAPPPQRRPYGGY